MPTIQKLVISTQIPDQFQKLEALLKGNFKLLNIPMIQIEDVLPDLELLDEIKKVNEFDWILFTSMRGVQGFFKLLDEADLHQKDIKYPKFSCIGNATNLELNKFGFNSAYINPGNTSKEFSQHLIKEIIKSTDKVLLPLGEKADTYLTESIQKVCFAKRINVYKTVDIEQIDSDILSIIDQDNYGMLVFTSPSAFDNFIALTGYSPETKNLQIATIGRRTSEAVENKGFKVVVEAKNSSMEGLASSIIEYFNN